ncbi:hypothetical protein ACP70R_000663 [Stipagrostis hirtigluma subsp. patula]
MASLDPSPAITASRNHHLPLPTASTTSPSSSPFPSSSSVPPIHGCRGTRTDMSRRLGRVRSDLGHTATNHGISHRSTSSNDSSSAGNAKQKLSLLFSGAGAWRWRRRESNGTGGARNQTQKTSRTGGKQRRGLRKYVSMVEQLFTSSSGGRRERERRDLPQRPHTFTTCHRGSGGGAPSKRHHGWLWSAPSSLKGSPANSGHLSVGESVKVSTSSEVSTMEELQSAIQAAIAHCKNSIAVAGGDKCKC